MSSLRSPHDYREPTRNDRRQRAHSLRPSAPRGQPEGDPDGGSGRGYVDSTPLEHVHDTVNKIEHPPPPREHHPDSSTVGRLPPLSALNPQTQASSSRPPRRGRRFLETPTGDAPMKKRSTILPSPSQPPLGDWSGEGAIINNSDEYRENRRDSDSPESPDDPLEGHIGEYYQTGEGKGDVERLDDERPRRLDTCQPCQHRRKGRRTLSVTSSTQVTPNTQVTQRGQCECGRKKIPRFVT
jgi:hypothetical protein